MPPRKKPAPAVAPIRSTQVYRVAKRALDAGLKANGFVNEKGSCNWRIDLRDGLRLHLWVQCDKNGWFREDGSQFTVNFDLVDGPGKRTLHQRFRELLDDADGPDFSRLKRAVAAKCPGGDDDDEVTELGPEFDDLSWRSASDPWFRYYDLGDVEAWCADYLLPRVPRMIDALLAGGDRRLPRATVDADIPGLSLHHDEDRACVVVPRQGVEALGRFLRGLPDVSGCRKPGILKAEGFVLLVYLLDSRRGSAPGGPTEIGFTGIRRADWDVGRSTRESLLAALETAEVGATASILERMGLVAIDSGLRLKIV